MTVDRCTHIVDDVCTKLFNHHTGNVRTIGIYRDYCLWSLATHDGKCHLQTFHLLSLCRWLAVRTCRTGAHIDDGSSFVQYLVRTLGNLLLRLHPASCIE